MSGQRILIAIAATLCLSGVLCGCSGESGLPCYPVRGQVVRDARPLAEALVVFHPLDQPAASFPKPMAICDAEGRFQLMTFHADDGAPAGRYRITVELRAPRKLGEEVVRDGPNQLPARFAKPETTTFEFEVTPGENEVPPLVIGSR